MRTRLFTPGPVEIPARILAALAKPAPHHRTEAFRAILTGVTQQLIELFGTEGTVVTLAGSGSAALEAAVVNLVEPGAPVLVVEAGKFGERWAKILKAYGQTPDVLSFEWGQSADPAKVAARLREKPAKIVFFTHSETSTGALNDAEAIARVAREHGALAVADCVTSIGVHDVRMDAMGLDVAVAGSQKGFMLPPGLAFVALGPKALAALEGPRLPRFYFDLRKAAPSAIQGETPFTPAISLVIALAESLAMMKEEGKEKLVARHARNAEATRAAARALGLKLFAASPSNAVTAIHAPEGIDSGKIVKGLRERHGMVIANGQDKLKGTSFRIGHMGDYDAADILAIVGALEDVLASLGVAVTAGAGVAAAQVVLSDALRSSAAATAGRAS